MLQTDSCVNETNALCDQIGRYCKTSKTYLNTIDTLNTMDTYRYYLDWEDHTLSSHGPGIACFI